jgi:hypothetical protein
MEDEVNVTFNVKIVRDVVMYELKMRVSRKVSYIVRAAGNQVVDTNNRMTFRDKSIAEM